MTGRSTRRHGKRAVSLMIAAVLLAGPAVAVADSEESEPTAPPSSSSTEPPAPTEPPATPAPTEPPVVESTTPSTPDTTVGEPPESTSPDGSGTTVPDSSAPDSSVPDSSAPSSSEAPAAPRLELPETLPHPDEWDGVLELKDLAPFPGEDFVRLTAGQEIEIELDGLQPGSQVLLGIFSDPVELDHDTADDDGEVEIDAHLPGDLLGEHTLVLLGTDAGGNELILATPVFIEEPFGIGIFAVGDLAWGVVYVDANKDNALTSSVDGEDDRGLAGVTVNALNAAGAVVATTVTDANGEWHILAADVDPLLGPAVAIEILTADVNNDVYAAHPATSADNDFARDGAPNRAVAPLPDPADDVELNALVYPVWKLNAQLANNANGLGGKAILTGAPTWDANDSEPGNDSGPGNDRVRSADIVSFDWSLTVESEDGSLGTSFTDAVFEQTITLNDGAVANFVAIPARCEAGSQIVAQPSGTVIPALVDPPAGTTSVTLTCVLGVMGNAPAPSAILFPTQVQPSSKSPNGSTFDTDSRFYAVDGNGTATAQPAPGPEVPPIEITAAPRYDVEKVGVAPGYTGTININGVQTPGSITYYTLQISTDRKVGVEAFQQPIELEESFWANRTVVGPNGEPVGEHIDDLKWYITACIPSPVPASGQVAGVTVGGRAGANAQATTANSVRDSGTCSIARTGDIDTSNYTLTLNGIDTSGLTYPTQYLGGGSLAAGPFYVASYRVQVFIPWTELDRAQGAPDDAAGEFAITNRVGDFDPDGISGASNFGTGVEPGYCQAGPPSDQQTNCASMGAGTQSNNVEGPVTIRVAPGSWSKYFLDMTNGWHTNYTGIPEVVTTTHTGTGQVQPGQTFSSVQFLNAGGTTLPGVQLCDVFDNTVLQLVPLNQDTAANNPFPDGLYSAVTFLRDNTYGTVADQQAGQANWVFEYGHIDLSPDTANNGTFDTTTNRFEGDWRQQRAAASAAGCAGNQGWSSTPSANTNIVRVSAVDGFELIAGDQIRWILAFEQRDNFNGGPNDGLPIPSGTVAANHGAVRSASPAYNPNWSSSTYIPGAGPMGSGENGTSSGDRWTVTRAQMRLQKRTIAATVGGVDASGVADYGVTGGAVAGKPVVWEIVTTLTARNDPAAPVNNVVVTDTLPNYVIYDEAGTQELATAGGFPMPTSVTLNGDGTTTVVWDLGTRTPNQDLPVLRIATYTDPMAPPNTAAVNVAAITAANITPVAAHTDDHTIRIEQTGEVQLKKSVDRSLDLQDDDQVWTLELKNFSATLPIVQPIIYEVFPYNGDATNGANVNRTPASNYVGTNLLDAAPVAANWDDSPRAGTFYYTTVPGAQVPQRQQDDTDASIWSTAFTPNATGFKFVAAGPLTPAGNVAESGLRITFQTNQDANAPGNLYTNRFTAVSETLDSGNQLLTSNTVSVRVIGFSLGDLWLSCCFRGSCGGLPAG